MPSAPVIDIDALLVPLTGSEPGGKKLPLLDRNKLKEYQRDFDPERDLTEDDRRNPQFANEKRKQAEWDKIIEFSTDYLKKTGRDLTVALALVEALTKQHGFAGARDGFRLLRRLCESSWDAMHPAIDDPTNAEDVEARMGVFSFIDDEQKTPFYPNSIRGTPLLQTAEGTAVSFLNCQAGDKMTPAIVSNEQFRASVTVASSDQIETVRTQDADLGDALDELQSLGTVLDAKAGKAAPSLSSVRKALVDCRTMAKEILRIRNPEGGGDSAAASNENGTTGSGCNRGGTPLAPVRSREDVYLRLNELATILEQFDPHSPVPYLVRRAVEMRELRFPDLVDQLTASKGILDFIRHPIQVESSSTES